MSSRAPETSKGALGVDFGTTNSSIALGSQTVRDHKGGAALHKIGEACWIICSDSKACALYLSHSSDTQTARALNRWTAFRNGWQARKD
jgi:hypothetical protein